MLNDELIAPEMPLAFDDAGRPIPVTEPVYDEVPGDEQGNDSALPDLLEWLLIGARNATEAGERAAFIGYLLNLEKVTVPRAPKSLRELAGWLGCSHVAARAKVNRFKAVFIEENADLVNRPTRR